MPAVIASEFLAVYPEFATFAPEVIDNWLQRVERMHCPLSVWTDADRQKQGIMLRTAHYLDTQLQAMAQTASMGAAVSTGQSSGAGGTGGDDLDQTVYGRQFKQLRRTLPTTGFTF